MNNKQSSWKELKEKTDLLGSAHNSNQKGNPLTTVKCEFKTINK